MGLGLMMHGKESDVELPMDPTSSQQDLRGFVCMVRLVKVKKKKSHYRYAIAVAFIVARSSSSLTHAVFVPLLSFHDL
jgi:hypothetical protein